MKRLPLALLALALATPARADEAEPRDMRSQAEPGTEEDGQSVGWAKSSE